MIKLQVLKNDIKQCRKSLERDSRNLRVYVTNEPGLVRKYQDGGLLQNCLCATFLLL